MVVHLAQPPRVRGFVAICFTPAKFLPGNAPLLEECWKLGPHDTRHPVHDEDLSSGELLRLIQRRDCLFHVADSMQDRNLRRVLGAQQANRAQVQRFLRIAEPGPKFVQTRLKEFRALSLLICIRVMRHEQE